MLVALLFASLAAALGGGASPLEPIAARIMERTPADVANALLDLLGPLAKPFAAFGAAGLLLVLGNVLGAAAVHLSARVRSAILFATAAGGLLACFTAPSAARLGLSVLALTWPIVLWWLLRHRRRVSSKAAAPQCSPARRRVLLNGLRTVGLAGLASVMAPAAAALRVAGGGRPAGGPLFSFTTPPPRLDGFDLAGLSPEISPSFYYMSKNVADPVLNPAVWTLEVSGLVERQLRLSLTELVALPRADSYVTQQCVSNPIGGPLMSAGLFSGLPLAELLALAGVRPGASFVRFASDDGQQEGVPLETALASGCLIAYGLNGDWLPWAHGFPARALVPGFYGFRSVKWLTKVELLAEARAGHWAERGWTAGPVHPSARIDLARPTAGGVLVAGVAFAGTADVAAVEVRANGGSWHPAELHLPPLSDQMWVQWRTNLPAVPAEVRLEARVVDGGGRPQDETSRGQFPDGATGLHSISLRV